MKIGHNWQLLILALALFVSSVVLVGFYAHFSIVFGGDQELSVPQTSQMYSSLFAWQPSNYSGFPAITWGLFTYVFFSLQFALSLAFGVAAGGIVSTAVFIWIGAFGMLLLVSEFSDDKAASIFAGICSVVLFSFIIGFHLTAFMGGTYLIPWVLLFCYGLYSATENNDSIMLSLFGLTVAASLFIWASGIGYLLQGMVFLVVLLSILLALCKRRRLKLFLYFLAAISIAILLNASWIVTTYTFVEAAGNQYFNTLSSAILYSNSMTLISSSWPTNNCYQTS